MIPRVSNAPRLRCGHGRRDKRTGGGYEQPRVLRVISRFHIWHARQPETIDRLALDSRTALLTGVTDRSMKQTYSHQRVSPYADYCQITTAAQCLQDFSVVPLHTFNRKPAPYPPLRLPDRQLLIPAGRVAFSMPLELCRTIASSHVLHRAVRAMTFLCWRTSSSEVEVRRLPDVPLENHPMITQGRQGWAWRSDTCPRGRTPSVSMAIWTSLFCPPAIFQSYAHIAIRSPTCLSLELHYGLLVKG